VRKQLLAALCLLAAVAAGAVGWDVLGIRPLTQHVSQEYGVTHLAVAFLASRVIWFCAHGAVSAGQSGSVSAFHGVALVIALGARCRAARRRGRRWTGSPHGDRSAPTSRAGASGDQRGGRAGRKEGSGGMPWNWCTARRGEHPRCRLVAAQLGRSMPGVWHRAVLASGP
jgi:hypothetical protein